MDVILLQETLGNGEVVLSFLTSIYPSWTFHTLDVRGCLGGSAIGFSNHNIKIPNVWGLKGILGADVLASEMGTPLRIINIYGPYHSRPVFWDKFL